MAGSNWNVPPGGSFPGLPTLNSSPAASVEWNKVPLNMAMPLNFPFARSAVPTSTPSMPTGRSDVASLLAAQMAQNSNTAALQALYATLANANSRNAGAMGGGAGDRGMLASLPYQAVQPVSTWPAANPFQLPPVPIAFSAHSAWPNLPTPAHQLNPQPEKFVSSSANFQNNFGTANFVFPSAGGAYLPAAHAPNTLEAEHAAVQASPANFGSKPAVAVVPRKKGKEDRVVLTLESLAEHFDKPLQAVSDKLGLSRSTIKAVAPRPWRHSSCTLYHPCSLFVWCTAPRCTSAHSACGAYLGH